MNERTLIDGRQLCDEIGMSRLTLRKRVQDGTIPAIKIGRLVRYDRREVLGALRASRLRDATAAVDGRSVRVASELVKDIEAGPE